MEENIKCNCKCCKCCEHDFEVFPCGCKKCKRCNKIVYRNCNCGYTTTIPLQSYWNSETTIIPSGTTTYNC